MNIQIAQAVLAGIFFGAWPLFMNRSGLSGVMSSVCYSLIIFVSVSLFLAFSGGLYVPTANWSMVFIAGILGAIGLLFFNSMLAKATPEAVGSLFVIMTIVQIITAAVYKTMVSGTLPPDKLCGYLGAVLAAYLLIR